MIRTRTIAAPLASALLAVSLSLSSGAFAGGHTGPGPGPIGDAMKSDIRTDAEKARDRNRQPSRTLKFFGFEPDQKVVEFMPGGGWYAKILVPALADDGEYIAVGGLGKALGFSRGILMGVRDIDGFDDLQIVDVSDRLSKTDRIGYMDSAPLDFGVTDADLVLTFRNLHNFSEKGRMEIHKGAYAALKEGGRYGVVDHTRRHMAPLTDESWRRLDPVQIIKEANAAGFKLADYSKLHYKPDDELRYEVGRKSVQGNSDRFTLLFVK